MSLNKIVVGDYGQSVELTFIDVDTSAAADISSYTTAQQMIFTDPEGNEGAAVTAAFKTDGTDGIITYTIPSGLFDAAGNWTVRGRVTTGSAQLSTEEHTFNVLA